MAERVYNVLFLGAGNSGKMAGASKTRPEAA